MTSQPFAPRRRAGLAAAAALLATSAAAPAATIYSNATATAGGADVATGSTELTATFTTGSTAVTALTASLLLQQVAAGSAEVDVYTDGGLQPGTLVAALTSPAAYSSAAVASTDFTSGSLSLSANTAYWLVLKANSGTYDWEWTSDFTVVDGSGQSPDAGATWFTTDAYPYLFTVTNTVNAVPEPATASLLAAAGLPMLARRRRGARR